LVSINGQMAGDLKEVGSKINYMVEVYTLGQMVEAMTVNIMKIRNMVLVFISGQMVKNMRVTGKMESSMGKVNLLTLKESQE
jgi:hypothetical protein